MTGGLRPAAHPTPRRGGAPRVCSGADPHATFACMPISKEHVLEIARRLARGGSLEELARHLAPVPKSARPFPPDVPRPSDSTALGRDRRVAFLSGRGVQRPQPRGASPSVEPPQ